MSRADLDEALRLIADNADAADFEGNKPESLILSAEEALGLDFPPSYREFLGHLGCGDIAGAEFYGIITDPIADEGVPNTVWLTLDERASAGLPRELILVADTGDGGYYALDTSQRSSAGECPIVLLDPHSEGDKNGRTLVAEDFGAFLLGQVREALE